jgi:hypothetical protein
MHWPAAYAFKKWLLKAQVPTIIAQFARDIYSPISLFGQCNTYVETLPPAAGTCWL